VSSQIKTVSNDSGQSSEKIALHAVDLAFDVAPKKKFEYVFDVFLKDSNAFGNVYFAKYIEWQGVIREKWFSTCIFPNMLELPGNLVTKDVYNQYLLPVYPFQKVKGTLTVDFVKNCSLKYTVSFTSECGETLYSKGYQTVAYTDKSGKVVKIPQEIKFKFYEYMA